ncbi:hypothetical protein [Mycolicibacterium sp. HS_4_1]
MSRAITSPGRGNGESRTEPLPAVPAAPAPLTGFGAGATGAALLVGGVWGMHLLSPLGRGVALSPGAVVLLLVAFTALGKGISLLQKALAPVTTVAAMAVSGVPAMVRAIAAIVAGAAGIWWVLRGHAAFCWALTTGTTQNWSLILALVQVALIAVAGAMLFGGAKNLAGLLAPASAARHRSDRWVSWWSSRPGLGVMLLGGATATVVLSAYIVPRVSGWLLGDDLWAALTAIVVVLTAGLLANTWWWGALSGWWTWAHRPHTPGGTATPVGQIHASAAVVALLWFSATAFGLAVPDSYTGPGAMPRAHADCPPDCGGSAGSGSFGPDPSQFQPPQMTSPPGQYQGGANSGYPGPDQGNGISIYNPSTGQTGPSQGGYSPYPAQGQPGPPANGVQPPNYDAPRQPQAPAPQQGAASPQQAPPLPQQAPAQQGPPQPAQQPQGQAGQQNQGPQQPNQSSDQQQRVDDLTRQLHDQQQRSGQDRQRIDDLTKQLQQNTQNQKQQQSPKFPSKDKKNDKDDQKNRDDQSGDSDLTALLLGASSTRRRKQDGQEKGPDTEALGQDASQAAQGIPGDVQTYVQSGQQIGESSGQAAQGFGQAGQAGASLASSAQSGAVNPQDVQSLIQGVSQGVQGTADAVNSGAQIVRTGQNEADEVAQAVGDANPQLKPQMDKLTQLNDQVSQVTDGVGQGAQLTSQGAGAVNTVSSLGAGGAPDIGGTASDAPSQAQTIEKQSGDLPADASGAGLPPDQNEIQQLLDQAIVDRQQQAQSLQHAFDNSAAQAYMQGPGTSGFDSATAQAGQLRGPLAQLYGDIGALSHSADSVGGLQGGLQDGTGTLFDPSNMFQYTFKDGALTSVNYLDPGQVQATPEPLLSVVMTIVPGGWGAARGISALLSRGGGEAAASVTTENVLSLANTAATTQASSAAARLAANQAAGNAFRDGFAQQLGGAANNIQTEAYRSTSLGARYIDVLNTRTLVAFETKVGRTAFGSRIRAQVAKDAELLTTGQVKSVTWVFKLANPALPASAANGGPTANLLNALTKVGIGVLYR